MGWTRALPDTVPAGRLELRRWRRECAAELLDAIAASLPELQRWMPWAKRPPTLADQEAVLTDGERAFDAGTDYAYFLREADEGALVGCAGLHRRLGPGAIEIGYWVCSDRHGRGYATAAARALTTTAFRYLADIDRVEIHMDKANHASAAVPRKLGYTLVGEEERKLLAPGHTGKGWIWATRRTDWSPSHESG